jgi:hypothetical protein
MKCNKSSIMVLMMLFIVGYNFDVSARVVYVKKKPPVKKIVVVKSKPPFKNGIWISGQWNWNGHRYSWVKGRWEKPRKGFRRIDGHWKITANGWIWIKGHWEKM